MSAFLKLQFNRWEAGMPSMSTSTKAIIFSAVTGLPGMLAAQHADLSQELANPIAAIISLPLELTYDDNLGVGDTGNRTTLTFKPVVPFSLDNGANIVTRTIIPFVWQNDVVPGTSTEGLGDITFSAWYTETTARGLTWGVGPALRIPSGTRVSTDIWALGPTAIIVNVKGPWTFGALANHIWDVESDPDTPTNSTFLQPFVSYNLGGGWSLGASSESTYDWETEDWSVPVKFSVSKLTKPGRLPINWTGSIGYWAESPDGGPEGARASLQMQIVIPK